MELDDIEFIGFHEEVDDINEKLHYLDNSYSRFEKIFLKSIKDKKFRSEIVSKLRSMIDVAYDVKLILESIFLPHSTSIPCLTDLRRKLLSLVYTSNFIRRGVMKRYENRVVHRLRRFWREITCKNAQKDLSIEMFLSMIKDLTPPTTTTTDGKINILLYEEDFELIATMQKVVKERHEEVIKIEKRMIELEQVLFQMNVMVQEKLVILVNEQGSGDNDQKKEYSEMMMKIFDSVEHLVETIDETHHKREIAKHDRRSCRILLMALMLGLFVYGSVNILCSGWFKVWMEGLLRSE